MKRTGKGRILRNGMKCVAAYALAFGVGLSMPMSALAETWYIDNGSITVAAKDDGHRYVSQGNTVNKQETSATVITQTNASTATGNNLTINAASGQTAEVTLNGVNIKSSNNAAVATNGKGNVSIELDGSNTLRSGFGPAGLEKGNSGTLSINDDNDENGSLEAVGMGGGAGIGGGFGQRVSNIEIKGGTVTATGGDGGAGIGGGDGGHGEGITISGGTVTATGEGGGAGIGGGIDGKGEGITISGGIVDATGMYGGAGIGGGIRGNGEDITISGGKVDATGTGGGAGIGGGVSGTAGNVAISGDANVTATGADHGAAIGNGYDRTKGKTGEELQAGDGGLDTSGLTTGSVTKKDSQGIIEVITATATIEEPEDVPPTEEPVPESSDPGENPSEEPATENPIEEPKVEAAFPANASVKNSSAPTIASYKVYIASVENGTITADLENAKPGDTVKVTAAPDAGYALESISVKTDDGQEVPVTEVGGGVFTFTMPNGHVTISAVFVPVKADVAPVSEKAQTAENSVVEAAETTSEDASLTGSGISLNILPIELEFVKDSEPAELQAEPSAELVAEPWTETAVVEPQVEPIAVDSQVEAVTEPQPEPVVLEAQAETQNDSALPEETMTLQ